MKPTETPRPEGAFRHEMRVSWGDCDPARIVYTGKLPAFALEGINAWWEAHLGVDWYRMELDRNVGTPFVHLSLDFCAPVTPRHRLILHVWPHRLGTTSIDFRVDGEQDETLCFSGFFTSVFIVADAFRKSPPPVEIRDLVAQHLPQGPVEV